MWLHYSLHLSNLLATINLLQSRGSLSSGAVTNKSTFHRNKKEVTRRKRQSPHGQGLTGGIRPIAVQSRSNRRPIAEFVGETSVCRFHLALASNQTWKALSGPARQSQHPGFQRELSGKPAQSKSATCVGMFQKGCFRPVSDLFQTCFRPVADPKALG